MNTSKNLTVLLALALGSSAAIGCAADAPGSGNDGGGGNGGGGGGDTTPQTDATGKYSMRSTFDIATNMPGKVGVVVNTIIAATDGGDDPAAWILELAIAQMPNGTFKNLLNGAKPLVAGYLNQRLLQLAPDFVSTMVLVGNDFGDMAKHVGLNETLDVTKVGADYAATKTVLGAHFKIDQTELDLAFADYQVANVVVPAVGITLDATGKLGIGQHTVPLSYGKVLRIGLDGAIIPLIDPAAHNLAELLQARVDCQAVGSAVSDALGLGGFGASAFTTGCRAGIAAGANLIYAKIDAVDSSALEFGLVGSAKAVDKNNDKKIDGILTGTYTGNLSYAGTPAPLAAATFYGERM